MKPQAILMPSARAQWLGLRLPATLAALLLSVAANGQAVGPALGDSPLFANVSVPANLILDLSVEFPTAVGDAYASTGAYSAAKEYLGYFNPNYCYDYVANSGANAQTALFETLGGYFKPAAAASSHACSGHWSGNLLNWVMTQTIDPLRKTLTGGARIVDTSTTTVLQKAYQDLQSGGSNQNIKSIVNNQPTVAGATPFTTWKSIYFNNRNTGLNFVFSQSNTLGTGNTTGTDFGTVTVASAENGIGGCSNATSGSGSPTSPTSGNIAMGEDKTNVTVTTTPACTNGTTIRINGNKVATGTPGGTVQLSVTGLTGSGVTASLSPTSVLLSTSGTDSKSSTLTLTAGPAAVAGTYTVTITGIAGIKSAQTTLTLTVAAPTVIANNTFYQAQSAAQVCTSGELTGTYSDKESNSYGGNPPDGSVIAADGSKISVKGRCRAYGANYKPVGLMQKYAAESTSQNDTIRYSAFGYMLDAAGTTTNEQLDGGVLRAKMKSVGPYQANPGQTVLPNLAKEWDAATGVFVANPDTADATATGVSRSGVANYLNLFGFVPTAQYTAATRNAYKRFDSVSELYYMATRYYRNLGNLASHTDTATAITSGEATNDNFPVIKAWDDPIKYSCSANYIVGIGDIHTWNDSNLPGATAKSSNEVAAYAPGDDAAVAVSAATNYIANAENMAGDTGGLASRVAGSFYTQITGLGNVLISNSAPDSRYKWGASQNTFYMAGLAFDAHVRDIRPDIKTKSSPITVSTFWLDVMEGNDYHQKNQFWMTAKYGGFDTTNTYLNADGITYTPFPITLNNSGTAPGAGGAGLTYNVSTFPTPALASKVMDAKAWNASLSADDRGNYVPDQYYQAGSPAKMAAGLESTFAKIGTSVPAGVSAALGLNTSSITSANNVNYVTSYNSDWSGSVVAQTLAVTLNGNEVSTTATPVWDAKAWLPPSAVTPTNGVLTYDTRKIATSTARGASKGVPFRLANIPTQAATLGASAVQANMLNYLRGDTCNELANNAALSSACQTITGNTNSLSYRPRGASVLGDITNSKPAIYGVPSLPYADAPLNPGYSSFKTSKASRTTMLYVGANDGMLHAFDGSIGGANSGHELFAYVPSALLTTNTDANGNAVGLASLSVGKTPKDLKHHFMVDAQPVVVDIDFNRVGLSTSDPTWPTAPSDWHTLVISGLGKGGGSSGTGPGTVVGGGYFALDVTDPAAIGDETALASKVKWETDPTVLTNMGYSSGEPLVIKTKKYGWTLVLTSGYGNADGKGYIYLVNPVTGALYENPIATSAGSTTAPAGLARVTAFVPNQADFTADALYAGDLLGNVWRVDLTYTSGSGSAEQIASLTAPDGTKLTPVATTTAQPITMRPVIGVDPTSGTRYVFVGTGQLLSDNDLVNPQTQAFYALKDGNSNFGGFDTTSTFPITSGLLTQDDPTDTTTGPSSKNGIPAATLGSSSYRGFVLNLAAAVTNGAGTQASAERVNVQPVASGGVALVAANLYGQDICVKGSSRIFALNYDSGSSLLVGQSKLLDNSVPIPKSTPFVQNLTAVVTNLTLAAVAPPLSPSSAASGLMALWGYDTTANGSGQTAQSTVGGDVLSGAGNKIQRINWREVPSSN